MSDIADIAVVGLTGPSGAGKTTVCEVFRDNGFAIINADNIAREIMHIGSPCLNEAVECFGKQILNDDGSLNRVKMAEIVFKDKEKLLQYNAICYPYITHQILIKIKQLAAKEARYVLLDAPTLFESRADDFCDLIISVMANEENRVNRIINRDNICEERIRERFASQYSDQFFVSHSDFIIINNKSIEELLAKAKEVSEKIKEYYNAKESQPHIGCCTINNCNRCNN